MPPPRRAAPVELFGRPGRLRAFVRAFARHSPLVRFAATFGFLAAVIAGVIAVSAILPPPRLQPAGAQCWRRPIFLRAPGAIASLSGFEDLAYDPATGDVWGSAYDRRKGAPRSGTEGLYRLGLWLLEPPPRGDAARGEWRRAGFIQDGGPDAIALDAPHGIAFSRFDGLAHIAAISRRIVGDRIIGAEIVEITIDDHGRRRTTRFADPRLKTANDLVYAPRAVGGPPDLWISFDRNAGADRPGGHVGRLGLDAKGEPVLTVLDQRYAFANGLAATAGTIYVAETRADRLSAVTAGEGVVRRIALPGAPDNLNIDAHGRLIAALHPNLLRFALYRFDWISGRLGVILGLRRAASRVVRADPATGRIERLLDIPADGLEPRFSGATSALAVGDYVILGGARENGVFVCHLPDQTRR